MGEFREYTYLIQMYWMTRARSCNAKNKTNTDTSRATFPNLNGGISRRSSRNGGSVTTKIGSATIENHRGGLNSLEKDAIISMTIRASNTYVYSEIIRREIAFKVSTQSP